jgi:hypothetical protein
MANGVMLGAKLRRVRRRLGLTQVEMAERLGISASYFNLIEHDQRALTLKLMLRLGQVFDIDLDVFSESEEARLLGDLGEALADPVLRDHELEADDLRDLVSQSPAAGKAMVDLYRAFREARDEVRALREALRDDELLAGVNHELRTLLTSICSFSEILHDNPGLDSRKRQRFLGIILAESKRLLALMDTLLTAPRSEGWAGREAGRPWTEAVADFIQDSMNYFPELEAAAEDLRRAAQAERGPLYECLVDLLARDHGIAVTLMQDEPDEPTLRRFDARRRSLALAEILPPPDRLFEVAHRLGLLRYGAVIDDYVAGAKLSTPEARSLCRIALASYFAMAVMMPYDEFLAAARQVRYDIERLERRFGASFEQVCDRLTTLHRPGAKGVPFHLVRVDVAGNVSKRFSASGLPIARYSGVCSLWNVHRTFLTPGAIHTQLSRMPDGATYFSVARTVYGPSWGYRRAQPVFAIELGCEASFAKELVYADGLVDETAVPIGTTCRLCERSACPQRAFPPARQGMHIDEDRRDPSPYIAL